MISVIRFVSIKLWIHYLTGSKTEQIEIESKLFWRNTTRQMYEHAIEACYLAGDLDSAFYFFEKSRAVILNDLLTEQRGQTNNDMLELSRARKKVSVLERQVQKIDSSSDAATEKQKELLDSRHQLDKLDAGHKGTESALLSELPGSQSNYTERHR